MPAERRLLLPHQDVGMVIYDTGLQLGLNFADITPELFAGQEVGEDALRVMRDYRKLYARITADVKAEVPQVRASITWAKQI
jgi:hypothetical protein